MVSEFSEMACTQTNVQGRVHFPQSCRILVFKIRFSNLLLTCHFSIIVINTFPVHIACDRIIITP